VAATNGDTVSTPANRSRATATDRRLLVVVGITFLALFAWAAALVPDTIAPIEVVMLIPGVAILCMGMFLLLRTEARLLGWLLVLQTFFILNFIGGNVYDATGATWAGALQALGWSALAFLSIAILLYPTGRPASRVLTVLIAVLVAVYLFTSIHWLGVIMGWWDPIADPEQLAIQLSTIPLFASFFEQARIFRRRPRLQQEQLKLYVLALATQPLYAVPGILGWSDGAAAVLSGALSMSFPIVILIGITRYRLYEIDRIISRTVAYALVIATLAVLGIGGVAVLTSLLPAQDRLAVALSTLVVMALFNPLRRRVVDVVDRRFDRTRYVARQVVEGFGRDVQDVTDPDEIGEHVHSVVSRTVAPTTVALWQPREGTT